MRKLTIYTANSRMSKQWRREELTFEKLIEKYLGEHKRTFETESEYAKMSKERQSEIKDRGGFVGGKLKDGKRTAANVEYRSVITADIDDIVDEGFLESFKTDCLYEGYMYSTHSSTEKNPRVRIVLPLTRDVSPEEYNAVSRYFAYEFGINNFDWHGFLPHQLMYWPSCPSDAKPISERVGCKGNWIDPDDILADHPDWRDVTELPVTEDEDTAFNVETDKAMMQDPLEKTGLIGAFCKEYYPISTAIDKYLSDVYEPGSKDNRYTYIKGSTANGVVVYQDKWVYSNHATDPCSGRLLNAYDLVRIHKFGDTKKSEGEMQDLVKEDPECKKLVVADRFNKAVAAFGNVDDGDEFGSEDGADNDGWLSFLTLNKAGEVLPRLENLKRILLCDSKIKGKIRSNEFLGCTEVNGSLPWKRRDGKGWTDIDESQLMEYLSRCYCPFGKEMVHNGINIAAIENKYHPVIEYFESLDKWDGKTRLETLLIDYLGADDTELVRAQTRKAFVACVKRVYEPGTKFDCMLTLVGPQGIGKSTILAKLAGDWFSDSLTLADMKDTKTGGEKLRGAIIMEISELSGIRKAEVEPIKAFISTVNDRYRAAYGVNVEDHLRHCIFIGTTNETGGFLRDSTGGRRFWPVEVKGNGKKDVHAMTRWEIGQIWGEAIALMRSGESIFLDPELEREAKVLQDEAIETDDRMGLVERYLNTKLPDRDKWISTPIEARRMYFEDPTGDTERLEVCNMEIWVECFGKQKADFDGKHGNDIKRILTKIGGWKWTGYSYCSSKGPYGKQRIWTREVEKVKELPEIEEPTRTGVPVTDTESEERENIEF